MEGSRQRTLPDLVLAEFKRFWTAIELKQV